MFEKMGILRILEGRNKSHVMYHVDLRKDSSALSCLIGESTAIAPYVYLHEGGSSSFLNLPLAAFCQKKGVRCP